MTEIGKKLKISKNNYLYCYTSNIHKEKVKTSATWKTIQGARKCGRNATK
jgi:hypothetical protein